MTEFVVARGSSMLDERVTADEIRITESGALLFTVVRPWPGTEGLPEAPGRRTRNELVMAFAPGRWVEVIRSDG